MLLSTGRSFFCSYCKSDQYIQQPYQVGTDKSTVLDDSVVKRSYSKAVELLARHPNFWATKGIRVLEWNEVLSITTTVSLSKEGSNWLVNQDSNSVLSIVPLNWNDAEIFPFSLVATIPQRLYLWPLMRLNIFCPLGTYPYSQYR